MKKPASRSPILCFLFRENPGKAVRACYYYYHKYSVKMDGSSYWKRGYSRMDTFFSTWKKGERDHEVQELLAIIFSLGSWNQSMFTARNGSQRCLWVISVVAGRLHSDGTCTCSQDHRVRSPLLPSVSQQVHQEMRFVGFISMLQKPAAKCECCLRRMHLRSGSGPKLSTWVAHVLS